MLAVSTTMWDLAEAPVAFAKRVLDLGCRAAVLDVRIPETRVVDTAEAFRVAGLPIVALEPPHPESHAKLDPQRALFPLCATDGDRRRTASRIVQRAIELAAEIETRTVIVHAGRVDGDPPEDEVRSLARDTESARNGTVQTILDARAKSTANLDALRLALDTLFPIAEKLGVRLALSNRGALWDVPTYGELDRLLREFAGAPLALWLDVGNAHRIAALGLKKAASWIELNRERFLGMYLHDLRIEGDGWSDALAPGDGSIDWTALGGEKLRDLPCALALPHSVDLVRVRDGIDRLDRLFFRTKT